MCGLNFLRISIFFENFFRTLSTLLLKSKNFLEFLRISGKPFPFRVFYLQAKDTGRLATTAFQGAEPYLACAP